MKFSIKDKGIGIYLGAAAFILSLVTVILYATAYNSVSSSLALLIVGMIVLIGTVVAVFFIKTHWLNLGFLVAAMLFGIALVTGLNVQLDGIGYVIAGLNPYSTISTYVSSAIIGIITLIVTVVASFFGVNKSEE